MVKNHISDRNLFRENLQRSMNGAGFCDESEGTGYKNHRFKKIIY